jgi:hypothetical protein
LSPVTTSAMPNTIMSTAMTVMTRGRGIRFDLVVIMPSSALGFWRGVRRIEVLGVRLGPAMRSRCSVFHQRLNLLGRSNLFLGVVQPQELVNSDSPQNDPFPCRPRLHHLGSRNDFGPL